MGFDGILGQEAAIASLRAQLARTGGSGSTLILGPEGTGRFRLAIAAAGEILGTDPQSAARVATLQHADLRILEAEEGIDGVRESIAALSRRPSEGKRQVLVVRDADYLVREAQNALLKTLEEPLADAAVLVVAESAEFLPETVVSRCRLVRARPLPPALVERVLSGLGVPPGAALDAEGSPGRAIYHHAEGIGDGAASLVELLLSRASDPLGEADRLSRRKPGEESRSHRRRTGEVLRVAAARLRRMLPESEPALRSVLAALGSWGANVSPPLLFASLSLHPWTRTPPR